MMMRLSEVALAVNGQLSGDDIAFDTVSTDSRAIKGGELFIALRGEHFDGHDFVAECLQRGASAGMVDKRSVDSSTHSAAPLVVVQDTRLALGDLARHWRGKFAIPLAAITGSNGKTTVKEMLAAILHAATGSEDAVLATQGNLNNDIGLPLTLLKLRGTHQYAVIEMGMNHPGEIAYLTRIARPDVALINNALPAHLEGLGSVEAVARAKGEIFQGLATHGTAIINADDAYAEMWRQLAAPHRVLTFGLDKPADVSANYQLRPDSSLITLITPAGEAQLQLPVAGRHNVCNALAATASALAMQVPLVAIVAGLQSYGGVKGRLQRMTGLQGCTVIDDTYNANPASMRAAIDVLSAHAGERILVLGDMGELGSTAAELHAEIGHYAQAAKLDGLMTLGEMSKAYGGQHFDAPEALVDSLRPRLNKQTTILVKGSRFMRMERVVALLTKSDNKETRHAA